MRDDQLPSVRQRKVFAGVLAALFACAAAVPLLSLARCGGSDGSSGTGALIAPPEEFADRITTYEGTDHFTYTFPEEDIAFDEEELRFYADDTLYVVCEEGVTDAEKIELAEQVDGTIVGHLDMSRATLQIHVGDTSLADLETLAADLEESDAVVHAEPEMPIFLSPNDEGSGDGSDPQEEVQWAQIIGAPTAWEYEDLFGEVTVGVIDTGIEHGHRELDGVVEMAPNFDAYNSAEDHGTAVASIIGAIDDGQGVRGVASGADGAGNVHIYEVWGTDNDSIAGYYESKGALAGAIRHLAQDDLGHGSPARVINCSFGTPGLDEFDDDLARRFNADTEWLVSDGERRQARQNYAVATSEHLLEIILFLIHDADVGNVDASTADFLIVQSAGNSSEEAWLSGLAAGMDENLYDRYVSANGDPGISFEEIHARTLVVGSTGEVENKADGPIKDIDGSALFDLENPFVETNVPHIAGPADYLADFSCYGEEWVDICAPGDHIKAAAFGDMYKDDFSGTSFSAPMVAGTAAALWSMDPNLTAKEVRSLILDNALFTCWAMTDYQSGTYPVLDAGEAVKALAQRLETEETTDDTDAEAAPADETDVPEQLAALADELGVVPTGTEVFERPGTTTLTLVPSDRLDGLLGAELYDYDGDGQVELLVAALDAGGGWETGVSADNWNTVDLVIQVYEVAASTPGLADEVRFAVSGLPDEPMLSGVQLFRAQVNGETLIYVDSDWVFNDICASTLALRYTSGGSLEVAGGAQRFEHYNFVRCYQAVPGMSGAALFNARPFAEDWEGWELTCELSWADDEGESPDPNDVDAYRACYRSVLSDVGLTWETGRSMLSEDGDTYLRPGYPHPRAGELFQLEDGGEIAELCGVFTTRPESGEGVALEVFDNTGLLDGWR